MRTLHILWKKNREEKYRILHLSKIFCTIHYYLYFTCRCGISEEHDYPVLAGPRGREPQWPCALQHPWTRPTCNKKYSCWSHHPGAGSCQVNVAVQDSQKFPSTEGDDNHGFGTKKKNILHSFVWCNYSRLKHLLNHGNMFETGVVGANEC